MTILPIHWQIPRGEYINGATPYAISEVKCNHGYKIVCVWSNNFVPKSIQVHQEKVGGDSVFSGELVLLRNDIEILRKKYVHLIQPGSKFITIKLEDATLPPGENSDVATFSLKGHVKIGTYNSFNSGKQNNLMSSLLGLSRDFKKLLNPENTCFATDVTLKCGGGSIPAHKIVLAARSPVFNNMFTLPMLASRQKEVVIKDVDETTMRALVNYMYTGSIATIPGKTINRLVGDLLLAADKYEVFTLKTYCCHLLKKHMTSENVLWILELGDSVAADLKSSALDFICNCPEFATVKQRNSEAWKSLEREKPDLAMEVLSELVKSKDEKIKRIKAS